MLLFSILANVPRTAPKASVKINPEEEQLDQMMGEFSLISLVPVITMLQQDNGSLLEINLIRCFKFS